MEWNKIIILALTGLVLIIGRKSFLKNIYTRTGFIIVALLLFFYSDFLVRPIINLFNPSDTLSSNTNNTISDGILDSSKIINNPDSIGNSSGSTEYADTVFRVNSVRIHFREKLIAPPEDIYSYPTTLAMLNVINENDSVIQKIELEIDAISSPIETDDSYNILGDDGITLDYNFDGYDDLALRFGNGSNNHAVNGYFYIYLFNPETKQFDKYGKELNNPVPDPANKKVDLEYIVSTVYPHTVTDVCEWIDGELVIVESVEYQQIEDDPKDGSQRTKATRTYYVDGKEIRKIEKILKDDESFE